MPTAGKIEAQNASRGRVGQVSVISAPIVAVGGLMGRPQVNATGSVFWSMGSPLCAGADPHPYPDSE